jgi:hypothetical protein
MIGGVASGLGHYFGLDAVGSELHWYYFAGFGTGILAISSFGLYTWGYNNISKLEMTGEPVTISNIERKVREEFENVSINWKTITINTGIK